MELSCLDIIIPSYKVFLAIKVLTVSSDLISNREFYE